LRLEPDVNAPESIEFKPVGRTGTTLDGGHPVAPGPLVDHAQQAARRQRARRATFIRWLRKVHGWVGLWGAALGLLFGVTGFLLNHRARAAQGVVRRTAGRTDGDRVAAAQAFFAARDGAVAQG
jgi:hypothetical protein